MKCEPIPPDVFYEEINHPPIKLKHPEKEEAENDVAENSMGEPHEENQEPEPMEAEEQVFQVEPTWMQPLFDYLADRKSVV